MDTFKKNILPLLIFILISYPVFSMEDEYGSEKIYITNKPFTFMHFKNSKNTILTYVEKDISGDLTIPSKINNLTVTKIAEHAFESCLNIKNISIPETVNSIGDFAFYGCSGLKQITIPDQVEYIGDFAFYSCSSLLSIELPKMLTSIGNSTFDDCTSLKSVIIKDKVTSIGHSAFEYCTNLTNIIIPDSVMIIGRQAFRWCSSLTSITVPVNVISIDYEAFSNNLNLKYIKMEPTIPPTLESDNTFTNINNCTLHIKKESSGYNTGEWTNLSIFNKRIKE